MAGAKNTEFILENVVLLTIFIRSVSYIPLIFSIEQTQYVKNIPYLTLFLDLLSAMLLVIVALIKGYKPQLILFIIMFFSILTIVMLKFHYEGRLVPATLE